ncbi:MAG: acetylxylan esterase, partial [Gemmatimonadota bacterium]|nr:acetylxylan esterase [Gemmatimonadota bacterium]
MERNDMRSLVRVAAAFALLVALASCKTNSPDPGPTAVHADVDVKKTAAAGVLVTTPAYQVAIGANGFMQSIRVGEVEMLSTYEPSKTASLIFPEGRGGRIGAVEPDALVPAKIVSLELQPKATIVATYDNSTVTYVFREKDFDLIPSSKQSPSPRFVMFPSADVVSSFDLLSDNAVSMSEGEVMAVTQEGMRWVTRQGPMLKFTEVVDGYASFNWWQQRTSPFRRAVDVPARADQYLLFTIYPIAKPALADALAFDITAVDPGFMLPGGKPAKFDIGVSNVGAEPVAAEVEFQVRDFLTQAVLGRKTTTVTLARGAAQPVAASLPLSQPGTYRAAIVVKDGEKALRELAWIFVYDFAHYKPKTTRQPDFKAFWKKTLDELAAIPIEPKLKLNEKFSNTTHEVYEVSMNTLGGERAWAWFSKPRKPGKYPVVYRCPPTSVYQPVANQDVRGEGDSINLSIAIHGFDLHRTGWDPNTKDSNWYLAAGIESKETARWRIIFATLVRGMDFLLSRPEVDPKRIAVVGSSQGGGLAIVLAGLRPQNVAFLSPSYAGLCRIDWTIKHDISYWPFTAEQKPKGQTMEQFLATASYFDAANFAPDVRCPTVAMVGLLDWVTASGGQMAALAHLKPGQVQIISSPWTGHGGGSVVTRNRYYDSHRR